MAASGAARSARRPRRWEGWRARRPGGAAASGTRRRALRTGGGAAAPARARAAEQRGASAEGGLAAAPSFDVGLAILLGGFAFDVYQDVAPEAAVWSGEARGLRVAWLDAAAVSEVHALALELRPCSVALSGKRRLGLANIALEARLGGEADATDPAAWLKLGAAEARFDEAQPPLLLYVPRAMAAAEAQGLAEGAKLRVRATLRGVASPLGAPEVLGEGEVSLRELIPSRAVSGAAGPLQTLLAKSTSAGNASSPSEDEAVELRVLLTAKQEGGSDAQAGEARFEVVAWSLDAARRVAASEAAKARSQPEVAGKDSITNATEPFSPSEDTAPAAPLALRDVTPLGLEEALLESAASRPARQRLEALRKAQTRHLADMSLPEVRAEVRRRAVPCASGRKEAEAVAHAVRELDSSLRRGQQLAALLGRLEGSAVGDTLRSAGQLLTAARGDVIGALRVGALAAADEIPVVSQLLSSGDAKAALEAAKALPEEWGGDFRGYAARVALRAQDKAARAGAVQLAAGRALMTVAEGSAWAALSNAAGGSACGADIAAFDKVCFVEDCVSDTQVSLHRARSQGRCRLVVSFRGTETTKWQDIATDLNYKPTRLRFGTEARARDGAAASENGDESAALAEDDDAIWVHSGFLEAYNSVRDRLLQVVGAIVDAEMTGASPASDSAAQAQAEFELCCTGHSLGGALATLFAYDVSQLLRAGDSGEAGNAETSGYRSLIAASPAVRAYTYGSPRVGSAAFVSSYAALVLDTWRVYNVRDVVPTVPRLLGFAHVPHGVLLNGAEGTLRVGAACRYDGADRTGVERDVLANLRASALPGLAKQTLERGLRGEAQQMGEALGSVAQKLVGAEMEMLASLSNGSAIAEHMEDLYFQTLQRVTISAIRSPAEGDGNVNRAKKGGD